MGNDECTFTALNMLKFVQRCFLCVYCFLALHTLCTIYSFRINRVAVNSFVLVPKNPLRDLLLRKKQFLNFSQGDIQKCFLRETNRDNHNFDFEKRRLEEETWGYKGNDFTKTKVKGDESRQNLKEKKERRLELGEIKKWDVSAAYSDDFRSRVNKKESEKREPKKSRMNETVRKKMSELAKRRWQDKEERKKLLHSKKKFKHTEETKKLLSYKIKLKWQDESYRKRIIEKTRSFNQDENTKKRKSKILKEKWKIKEFREKMLSSRKPFSLERRKKISEIIKQKWKSEDYKQKTLKAIQENYKKRKLQVGLNPDFNYVQNVMLFKQLGLPAPKMRIFPDVHIEKLRKKKRKIRRKSKQDVMSYKDNWKHIYDSILHKNENSNSLTFLNKIDKLSISGGL